MEYYQYLFEEITSDQKGVLIAKLDEIGFTGFEEEDDALKAFINKDDLVEDLFEKIISAEEIKYSRSVIKEINWNAQWESAFEPVTVMYPGTAIPFVHIRAAFHKPFNEAKFEIVITPKMSFGTGHHATTHLMIEQMSRIDFKNRDVIDFGTGTAVLAILAEKLGARKIIAIDNDEWSINNAQENIISNGCEKISLLKMDTIPAGQKAAVVLSNINLNIIRDNLAAITNACESNAVILFSGIMEHDEQMIAGDLVVQNMKMNEIYHKDGWIALNMNR